MSEAPFSSTEKEPLKPIPESSFDGEHESVDTRAFVRCQHRGVELCSPTEVKCPCGAYWKHPRAREIYEHFKG
jgi:hypothetical protein